MKKARDTATEYNAFVPIESQGIQPGQDGDCFGHEYDAVAKACSVCADNEVCATLMMSKLQKKERVYLDSVDLELASDKWLTDAVKGWAGQRIADFLAYVSDQTKCPDMEAVKNHVLRFKAKTDQFKVKGGVISWES